MFNLSRALGLWERKQQLWWSGSIFQSFSSCWLWACWVTGPWGLSHALQQVYRVNTFFPHAGDIVSPHQSCQLPWRDEQLVFLKFSLPQFGYLNLDSEGDWNKLILEPGSPSSLCWEAEQNILPKLKTRLERKLQSYWSVGFAEKMPHQSLHCHWIHLNQIPL